MTTHVQTFEKSIRYDRESKDYMMLLDGELRGYARSYHEAEVTLDKLVYDLLQSDLHRSASELDGGSDADEIAADVAGEPLAGPALDAHNWRRAYQSLKDENERARELLAEYGILLFESDEIAAGIEELVKRLPRCPSCGDALTGDAGRCAACRESEPLTLPRAVALAVGGADTCAACRCTDPALPGGEFCAYHAHYALTTPFALGG